MSRVCFVSQVRPDRLEEYRERHAAVWPDMLEALRDTGWSDYRLFLSPTGLLVGVVETDDYEGAQAAMALTEVNARWQAQMGEFFVSDETRPDEGMVRLDEVFHLEGQLAAAGLATERVNDGSGSPA